MDDGGYSPSKSLHNTPEAGVLVKGCGVSPKQYSTSFVLGFVGVGFTVTETIMVSPSQPVISCTGKIEYCTNLGSVPVFTSG